MKPFIFAASVLILSGFFIKPATAHPPAYGPEGLIPHSHTISGTVVSGTRIENYGDPCPKVANAALVGARPTGLCIRVNQGRPVSHHTIAHAAPVLMQPPALHPVPVMRPVRMVQPVRMIQPVRVIQPVPVMRPVRIALPAANLPPQMVAQFIHKGELLTVTNTHMRGLLGMTLIKVSDAAGSTRGSWWTSEGQCFSAQAYLAQVCWSRAGYQARFVRAIKDRDHDTILANLNWKAPRSEDPCDHYSALEAKISEDDSGFCGY